jgi:hypothetical protein
LAAAGVQPDTGLLYVPTAETYAMYLTETDPRGAMGLGGKDEVSVRTMGSFISAIDYKTGKTVWKHKFRTTGNTRRAGLRRRRGSCCSAAMCRAISSRSIRPPERRCGIRRSAR